MAGCCDSKIVEAFFQLAKVKSLFPPPRGLPQGTFFILHGISMEMQQDSPQNDAPGVRISTISRQTGMSMPAVSQIVNTLEDKGVLERLTDKRDRRAVYVRPTSKGQTMVEERMRWYADLMKEVEEEFGVEKSEQLMDLLQALAQVVERVCARRQVSSRTEGDPRERQAPPYRRNRER